MRKYTIKSHLIVHFSTRGHLEMGGWEAVPGVVHDGMRMKGQGAGWRAGDQGERRRSKVRSGPLR